MTKGKKHMDGTKRCRIQFGLEAGESARTIAKEIGVSLTTVTREIRKHTYESFKGCYGRANQCVHRQDYRLTLVRRDCTAKGARCAVCSYRNCNKFCGKVEYIDCSDRLSRTAQVCNGCPGMKSCRKRKLVYDASRADGDYRRVLSEHRQGAALEDGELKNLDDLISPKIKDGQSVHHICVTNAAKLTRNEHTIQRYVNYGVLSAKRGDLKRACTVRRRKSLAKEYQHKVETGCYVGRTYADYERFLSEHPGVGPVYMDLVIGRPGGVCLLTLHWLRAGFMVGILIPNKCAANVTPVFDRLHEELGPELFAKLFPVILTDRGTEFSNPSRIEFADDAKTVRRTWGLLLRPDELQPEVAARAQPRDRPRDPPQGRLVRRAHAGAGVSRALARQRLRAPRAGRPYAIRGVRVPLRRGRGGEAPHRADRPKGGGPQAQARRH